MEREPIRQAQGIPSELTGQGQNAYSSGRDNIMPEPTTPENPVPRPAGPVGPDNPLNTDLAIRARGVMQDESMPVGVRRAAEEYLQGILPPMAGGSDTEPSTTGMGGMGTNESENEFDDGGELIKNPGESEENYLRRKHAVENGPIRMAAGQEAPKISEEDQQKANEAAARRVAKETVISWIIDPELRDEYFNEIYSLVDSRPYDFWNTAFDQLNDGAVEHHFNQTILYASKGKWGDISFNSRSGGAGISDADIAEALQAKYPDGSKSLDKLQLELQGDFERFQRERQIRRTLHDVNAVLYLPTVKAEQLFENMQQFDSTSGDIALSIPGVREMMNVYESVLREIMAENDGWLPSEAVLGKSTTVISGDKSLRKFQTSEAESRTKARFEKMAKQGLLVTRAKTKNAEGKWETGMPMNFKPWDIDRIFTLSRGMMIMEERLISLAAESKYPGNDKSGHPNSIRYASAFLQDVIQSTSTYAHMIAKWNITQEAMAAYLYKGEHNDTLAGLFKGWNPNELKKAYEAYEHDPEGIFRSLDETYYLGRRNPNRAGDIYTWISWRGQNKPDVPSMLQDFLRSGQRRMEDRWREKHPGQPIPEKYLNEYEKWTGTGFRFEKLRVDLSNFDSHDHEKHEKFEHALEDAHKLMGRMVDLQPHRIYLVSPWVRERVGKNLSTEQKATLSTDIENLSMVESAFLNARERLLDEGKTFDSITVEDMNQFYDSVISDPTERQRAKDLAARIRKDYADNQERYDQEFVYKRENTHGFVLWSGDTPADEYNFAALGATGGFVRRARDNANQAKATEAEVALLDNLKNITHPDQLFAALQGVYQHIDHYDRGKAQTAMYEKAEGLIKFYKATYKTKLPIVGVGWYRGKKSASYARMEYGSHQSAWESSDIRYFIEKLEHAHMITEEDAHKLMKHTGSTMKQISYEAGVGFVQLFSLAMLFITAELVAKNGFKDLEG